MRLNKRGFTLVEILATIIILGLLVTLGYVSVSSILDRSHDSYYHSQEDMLILAGREYFSDYRSELPTEVGDSSSVTLKELIDKKYIDPIKDRNDDNCSFTASSVTVQKINEKDYQYYATLVCSDYETNKDKSSPTIKFTPNKGSSQTSVKVTMKITDNVKVDTYRYVITKDGEPYQDSGYRKYTSEITFNFRDVGLYEISGYAMDSNGNTSNRKSGKYSIYESIDCGEANISTTAKANTWLKENVPLNITVPKNTYRYEVSSKLNNGNYNVIHSQIGSSPTTINLESDGSNQVKVVAYNQDGKSCTVTSDVYKIDKTPPNITSISGNPGCVKSPTTISIKLQATETGSGVAKWQYGYSTDNMIDYKNSASTSFTTTPFSAIRNQPAYFRACDNVGNCSAFKSTQICIQEPEPSVSTGGNTGKWVAVYKPRGDDTWSTCAYNGITQVCGNIIGKVDVSWINKTITIKWELRQGAYTWVGNLYYVRLIVLKDGKEVKKYDLKTEYGAAWSPGTSHNGSVTLDLDAGTYNIGFASNTFDPSYNSNLATITIK